MFFQYSFPGAWFSILWDKRHTEIKGTHQDLIVMNYFLAVYVTRPIILSHPNYFCSRKYLWFKPLTGVNRKNIQGWRENTYEMHIIIFHNISELGYDLQANKCKVIDYDRKSFPYILCLTLCIKVTISRSSEGVLNY